ncbi:MAG TPA: hypothetical protein ENI23_06100 [bacterium]|nr:hypothetical protein [bacterium]
MTNNKLTKEIIKTIKRGEIYRIAFLGDSITSAEWVHPNFREIIKYVLEEELTKILDGDWKSPSWLIRTYNAGLNGGTTKDMLKSLDNYVLLFKPRLVVLQGSRNDLETSVSKDAFTTNYRKLVKKLAKRRIRLLLIGTSPNLHKRSNEKLKPYMDAVKNLSKELNIQYIDLFNKLQEHDLTKFFTFTSEGNEQTGTKPGEVDPTHPNPLGNAYIAKLILKEAFSIKFDPEIYIQEVTRVNKYPKY